MAHVMKFIRRSHHESVAVFFDNFDRRGDDIQEQAFLRAAAMANDGVFWYSSVYDHAPCGDQVLLRRTEHTGTADIGDPANPDIGVLRKIPVRKPIYRPRPPLKPISMSSSVEETEKQLPEASRFFFMCDQSIHRNPALAKQYEAASIGQISAR